MTTRRRGAGVVAALALLLGALVLAGPVPSAGASGGVKVTVTSLTPAVATAGSTLDVAGTVTNSGDQVVRDVTVQVRISDARLEQPGRAGRGGGRHDRQPARRGRRPAAAGRPGTRQLRTVRPAAGAGRRRVAHHLRGLRAQRRGARHPRVGHRPGRDQPQPAAVGARGTGLQRHRVQLGLAARRRAPSGWPTARSPTTRWPPRWPRVVAWTACWRPAAGSRTARR